MKTKPILLCLMMMSVSFAGCLGGNEIVVTDEGDPVTPGELPDDWPTYYVATANDLPTCDTNTLGRLYYVEADTNFQACMSTGWQVVTLGGTSTTSTLTINQPPVLFADVWLGDNDFLTDDGDGTFTQHYFIEWDATDADGSITSVGVDYDNDGTIDYTLPSNSGMLTQETAEIWPGEYLNGSAPIPLELGNTFAQAEGWGEDGCVLILSKRFSIIAVDDLGGSTTQVISSKFVERFFERDHAMDTDIATMFGIPTSDITWITGSSCEPPLSTGVNNLWTAQDHPASTTTGFSDNLLRLSWSSAQDDLLWSSLQIQLTNTNNGNIYNCWINGNECSIDEQTPDSVWDATEIISLNEGGDTDICDDSGCILEILIMYNGVLIDGTVVNISVM